MKARYLLSVVLIVGGIVSVGCTAGKQTEATAADLQRQLTQKATEVQGLESSVTDLEKQLSKRDRELETQAAAVEAAKRAAEQAAAEARAAKEAAASAGTGSQSTASRSMAGSELLPPGAKSGECYARVFVPPAYSTDTERLLSREASERIEIIPAKYESGVERTLVKEASERIEVLPAEYGWVEERVMVKPASTRLEDVPAKYDWVDEKVLVKEAHTVWKRGRGPVEKVDNATGEIMCLVDVPATYKTVRKKVTKSPATTREIEIPAEYKTVKRQVVKKPATTRTVELPAEYSTVKVQKQVSPPKERRIEIPAEYQTVTKTRMVSDGRMEWRPVLCETNMNADVIRQIQRAVQAAGHDPGPIDGILGSKTRAAISSFQRAKGLPTGGLTMGTLKALNVNL